MGEILGYPCYTEFEPTNTNNTNTNEVITYTIDIVVLLNNIRYLLISNGSKNIDKKLHLIINNEYILRRHYQNPNIPHY